MFNEEIVKIDKIIKMQALETEGDNYMIKLVLEYIFSDKAKDGLKPVLEDFILRINKRLGSDIYWLVSAFDFEDYFLYEDSELDAYKKRLMSMYPFISYMYIEDEHIILLLNNMNNYILNTLENDTDLVFGKFYLTVFYGIFRVVPKDIINININDKSDIREICKELSKGEIFQISYFDSIGARIHEIGIKCDNAVKETVKNTLIEVFNIHDIMLEFN